MVIQYTMMEKYTINFPDGLKESFKRAEKSIGLYNFSFISDLAYKVGLSTSQLSEINRSFENLTMQGMSNSVTYADMQDVSKRVSEAVAAISYMKSEEIQQLRKFDFSSILVNHFVNSDFLKESIDTAYEIAQDKFSEAEMEDNPLESCFSSAEELEEAVNKHINDQEGFQETFANWSEKKKRQYYIIYIIIYLLWTNFCQPYFQNNIGMPVTSYIVSNVKELPEKGAKVICQLKQNIEAIILENTSYYYKVSFIDEDGNTKEGYVAKKNLKILDEEEDVEKKNEDEANEQE